MDTKPTRPTRKYPNMDIKTIYIIGGPLCGKTTFCKALMEKYPEKYFHVDATEVLRQGWKQQLLRLDWKDEDVEEEISTTGWEATAQDKIYQGQVFGIMVEYVEALPDAEKNKILLFDGFPRTTYVAQSFDFHFPPLACVYIDSVNNDRIAQRADELDGDEKAKDEYFDLVCTQHWEWGQTYNDLMGRYGDAAQGNHARLIQLDKFHRTGWEEIHPDLPGDMRETGKDKMVSEMVDEFEVEADKLGIWGAVSGWMVYSPRDQPPRSKSPRLGPLGKSE